MTSPDPTPRSTPPWLTMAVALLVSVATAALSFAVQWGTLGADVRNLHAAHAETRAAGAAVTQAQVSLGARLSTVEAEQQAGRRTLDTEIASLRREIQLLTRAVERLTDEPRGHARR
ncbi:hypothetical protein [Hyalangium sp.]|uniref:hypothetical protein n=1 Tax=Hyalangium sp. TaxID=2028555 RepID=UPI002D40A22C|nr:hypothetical protein [Hyalangium sp.]HYH96021.1 hypothetical protein [Hyalangium sp.]